jgi:hypothetical protein
LLVIGQETISSRPDPSRVDPLTPLGHWHCD